MAKNSNIGLLHFPLLLVLLLICPLLLCQSVIPYLLRIPTLIILVMESSSTAWKRNQKSLSHVMRSLMSLFFKGVVQADFAFFDPKPNDFHGVKTLLQTYLDDQEWDLSGFVDLILGQTTVGTVVKIEDDEDEGLFALVTVLNLWRYREQRCISTLKDFLLLKASQEKGIADQLKLLLGKQAHSVGLLVSQRVVNLPPQLLPHLYNALFDEVSWATEDEPTEELRNSFQFKHYIIFSKIYKHNKAEQKRKLSNECDEAIIYVKPEDEIFHKLSSWSFCFPLHTQQPAPHELRNYRSVGLVMAVKADRIPTFRQELVSLIDNKD